MLNKITLMGRLGKDPELRRSQNGVAVTTIRIACDRDFKAEDRERETDWFDVVLWRGAAEFVSKYFTKGRMIIVDGRLQSRKWVDNDGNTRYATEILADNVYFGDSKKESA